MASVENTSFENFDSLSTIKIGPSLLFLATIIPLHCYLLADVESVIIQVAGGFTVWSVGWGALEYILHKRDHSDRGSRHMAHHADPSNPDLRDVDLEKQKGRFFGYLLSIWFFAGYWVAVGNAVGLVCYYINYERVHQMVHQRTDNLDPWTALVLDWHAKHHDAWGINFSVTTPIWDVIEGTAAKKMKPAIHDRSVAVGWLSLFFPLIAPTPAKDTEETA